MDSDREAKAEDRQEDRNTGVPQLAAGERICEGACPGSTDYRDWTRPDTPGNGMAGRSCREIRSILESISDAFFSLDSRWCFTYVNETGERLLGKRKADLIEKSIWDLFPEARGSRFEQEYRRALLERIPVHFEEYYSPHKTWYEVRAYPSEIGISVYFADVTQRKQAEEELKKDRRRFALLAWTSNQLLSAKKPEGTLQQLCEEAMKELNCDAFLAYLNDDTNCCLHLHASGGLPTACLPNAERLKQGQGIAGRVAVEGRRIVLNFVQSSQELRSEMVRSLGVRAYACYPLIADQRVLGTLSFGTRSRDRMAQQELDLIEAFANQLAIAMGRRLVEERLRCLHLEEQKHSERLEAEVRSRTAQLASANSELTRRNAMLQSLTFQLTETEQRERRRLSEVLHDNLQQLLVAAKFRASVVAGRQGSAESLEDLQKVDQLLNESIAVSRSLAYELSPPILKQLGLGAALRWLADHMSQMHSVDIHVETEEQLAAASVSVFLFGAARELLLNVIKHAGVREAWLEARESEGQTRISVWDQGAGFRADRMLGAEKPAGLGLFAIRERVAVLGGQLEIEASPGHGTRVTVCVPHSVGQFGNSEF